MVEIQISATPLTDSSKTYFGHDKYTFLKVLSVFLVSVIIYFEYCLIDCPKETA